MSNLLRPMSQQEAQDRNVRGGSIFAFHDLCSLVEALIDEPDRLTWTTQGFGMIRAYLDPNGISRLNIWDDRLRVEGVSDIHSHRWSFSSTVIAGRLTNYRYSRVGDTADCPLYQYVTITPGPGGGVISAVKHRRLSLDRPEEYITGQSYYQQADEIHRTKPVRGTITINTRKREGADEALVFWERGDWVDAIPRAATKAEVTMALEAAHERLSGTPGG